MDMLIPYLSIISSKFLFKIITPHFHISYMRQTTCWKRISGNLLTNSIDFSCWLLRLDHRWIWILKFKSGRGFENWKYWTVRSFRAVGFPRICNKQVKCFRLNLLWWFFPAVVLWIRYCVFLFQMIWSEWDTITTQLLIQYKFVTRNLCNSKSIWSTELEIQSWN